LSNYLPDEYWSVIDTATGRKIADCGTEQDARMLVEMCPGARSYVKNTNHLMGPVIDIQMPNALPTNEVVFAGNYEGPQYAPHPDLLKQQYDKDKYLPDTQQEPFIATYHD
jgi:hypothetical protein